MLRFNDIADRIMEYDPSCDLALLQRAYVFSAKVHEGQERLSGMPEYRLHGANRYLRNVHLLD